MSNDFSGVPALVTLAFASLRFLPALWVAAGLLNGRFPGVAAHVIFVASMPVLLAPLWELPSMATDVGLWLWLARGATELAYGGLLALAVGLPLLAVRWAGALADAMAAGKDVKAGPFARFYAGFTLALFAAGGGLRLLGELWIDTLLTHPPGRLPADLVAAPLGTLGGLVAQAYSWMVTLSGPLLLGGLLSLLVVGLSARAMRGFGQWLSGLPSSRAWLVVGLCLLGLAGLGQALPARMIDRVHDVRSWLDP